VVNYGDASGPGLNLASLTLKLDGNTISATVGASQATALLNLTQGAHTLTASIADNLGDTSVAQSTFTASLCVCVLSPQGPDGNNGWYRNAPTISFSCSGSIPHDAYPSPFSPGCGGGQSFTRPISDHTGNWGQISCGPISVDTAPPTIAIAVPANGSFLNATSTTAVINYGDGGGSGLNLASLVVTLDGNPVSASAGASQATAALNSLSAGNHTLRASITDTAGNTASAQNSFTVAPVSCSYSPSSPNGGNGWYKSPPTISFNCGSNIPSSACPASFTAGCGGGQSFTRTISNWQGNWGQVTCGPISVDTAPPTIAIAAPANGSNSSASSINAVINYGDAGGSALNLASLVVTLDGKAVTVTAGASQATAVLSGLASGSHTLSASIADNAGNSAAAQSVFTVSGPAAKLIVSGPASVTAGTAASLTVQAVDAFGNAAAGYAGTISFTSTDPQASLPAKYTFTSSDAGTHVFSGGMTLKTAGNQTVTATDTSVATITGSLKVTVAAGPAAKLGCSGGASQYNAGSPWNVTVVAWDAFGNPCPYTGTVTFSLSDSYGSWPGNYTYGQNDGGSHSFSGSCRTPGSQTLTVHDTSNPSISGSWTFNVGGGANYTSIDSALGGPSEAFELGQVFCFPNPALGAQKPTFHVETGWADEVDIDVYNVAGGLVGQQTLSGAPQFINGKYAYETPFDDSGLGSGVYIYVATAKKSDHSDLKSVGKCAIIK
jgi:hypothetical protein